MNIIDKLKGLIFGARAEPAKQVPIRSAPQLGQANKLEVHNARPIRVTIGEMQGKPVSAWGSSDIIKGLRFGATMQLRTPLRVLSRHNEFHTNRDAGPPEIAHEQWEGIWVPVVFDGPPGGSMASSIGPIPAATGGDYLPFLLVVRAIVEADDSIAHRVIKLRELLAQPAWLPIVHLSGPRDIPKNKRTDWIVDYFFPLFVKTIPKLTLTQKSELLRLGLNNPNNMAAASDETLLSIKGIGQEKLRAIREFCASMKNNRDADRREDVIR